MPDILDRIYCSEQIHIPPTFPYIMKLYCKAAIRTQPYDLLKWSAAYFRALAKGEEPPVKERVEYPPYDSPSGLTPGFIKILVNQFGKNPETTITAQVLFQKWSDVCLDEYLLIKLIALLGARTTINWTRFVGVCAGFISKTLTQTMILICELFTDEPEGGMASVPFELFIDLYIFLAEMECGPLTERELAEQEAIMDEEDICEVAEKIRKGIFEGEEEGEYLFEEQMGEVMGEIVEEEELKVSSESVSFEKEVEEQSLYGEEELREEQSVVDTKEAKEDQEEGGAEKQEEGGGSEKSSLKDGGSTEASFKGEAGEDREVEGETVEEIKEIKVEVEERLLEAEESKNKSKVIKLEDLEETIRTKIEDRLGEEEESVMEGEEREFEELSSYLLGAAARVQTFTAEQLGYKIFKKWMRQEVPGIGPRVPAEQVEKVVNFMDYWSHKQEVMVMPRNIRHWMCPPLDKISAPQP